MRPAPNLPGQMTENDIPAARPAPDLSWEQFSDMYPLTARSIEKAYEGRAFEALMQIEAESAGGVTATVNAAMQALRDWTIYSRERAVEFMEQREMLNRRY